MKFRILSDIHNEFHKSELLPYGKDYMIPELPNDKETTLILAGDIGQLASPITLNSFLATVTNQFKEVFWIAGNHEWYKGDITLNSISRDYLAQFTNLHTSILGFREERILVVGATLWTDFEKFSVRSLQNCKSGMNDFWTITNGSRGAFSPTQAFDLHCHHKDYLFDTVDEAQKSGVYDKVIVVTHHHPSPQAILPQYKESTINGAFYSDLEEEIKARKIDYWICGHCHNAMQYNVGKTKVICNPKGYPFEDSGWDPCLTIEL